MIEIGYHLKRKTDKITLEMWLIIGALFVYRMHNHPLFSIHNICLKNEKSAPAEFYKGLFEFIIIL
jgi:hypothetical protein